MWEESGNGEGRWKELINKETGESSIKEHRLKVVWKGCKRGDHTFELTGNREATCVACGFIKLFVLGIEKFVDGKIIKVATT